MPPEPEDGPEVTTIVLRMPTGTGRVQRRFKKSDPVQILYDYVESLGEQV